ncbi:MAG: 3-oxoisoapionate decarboxylase [Thermoproteota archaeon]|nr:3-oxoisoapionate decarboxylase [Thermoproteota archaeon]
MQLGINTFTFPWAIGSFRSRGYPPPKKLLSTKDLLMKAKELGVNLVQTAQNLQLHEMTDRDLNELLKTTYDTGVRIEVGTLGINTNNLLKYLEFAKMFHSRTVRTVIPGNDSEEQIIDQIKRILPSFVNARVSLVLENYGHREQPSKKLANIMKKLDSPYVGINLDTANSYRSLEPLEQVVKNLAPYIIIVHFKDFAIEQSVGEIRLVGRPVGEGFLNVDWLLDILEKEKKDLVLIPEINLPFCITIENTLLIEELWAKKSIQFLRDKIK